jgi:hypothetical protein
MGLSDRAGGWLPRPAGLLRLALALLAAAALAGCVDADSLGSAPPTVIAVGTPPRWDNGIGTLLPLKCGVCHRVPAGPLSPAGIPQTFDLNYQIMSPLGVPGATDSTVQTAIQLGILRMAVAGVGPMPLPYATPLDPSEIQAIEDWQAAGAP